MNMNINGWTGRLRGAQGATEQRRQDLNRIGDFLIVPTVIPGRILVVGSGEIVVPVHFPCWFIDRPNFTFGGELEEGQFIEAGIFPTVSAVIESWEMKKQDRVGGGYYVGARIACVTTGKSDQRMWLHWRCEGKAMSNPSILED